MRNIKSHLGLKRTNETRLKMRLSQLGKRHSYKTKEKLRQINLGKVQMDETILKKRLAQFKPILQLTLDGKIIKEWTSATEASEIGNYHRNSIYRCVNGDRKTYRGFIWKNKVDIL